MSVKIEDLSDVTTAISHIAALINKPYEHSIFTIINTIEYAATVTKFYVNNKVAKHSAEPLLQLLKTLQKTYAPGLYITLDNAVNDLEKYIMEITVFEVDADEPGSDEVAQIAAIAAAVNDDLNKTEEDINADVVDKLTKFITEMNKHFPELPKEALLTCIDFGNGFASGIKIIIPENVDPTKFVETALKVIMEIFDIKEDEQETEETCSSPVRCKCHLLNRIREITAKHFIENDKSSLLSERRTKLGKQLIDTVVKHDTKDFADLFNKVIVLATQYDIMRTDDDYLQEVFTAVAEFIG